MFGELVRTARPRLAAFGSRAEKGEERGPQMTIVGSMVLLVGVSLVFGAIYYKTNRDNINRKLDSEGERPQGRRAD